MGAGTLGPAGASRPVVEHVKAVRGEAIVCNMLAVVDGQGFLAQCKGVEMRGRGAFVFD